MSLFVDVISVAGVAITLSGVTIKDLVKSSVKAQDKQEIGSFITFLEGRKILLAPMDDENIHAVIHSLEEIKIKTEELRSKCNDESIRTVLLRLVLTLSEELHKLHTLDYSTSKGKYNMYRSLQKIRLEFSKALAMFCAAFKIDPSQSHQRLSEFILNFAIRPRN